MDTVLERQAITQRGKRIEFLSIGWNTLEGLVALAAGMVAGSIALVGFGMDSLIEVASALALIWRMSLDADIHARGQNEKTTLRIVGLCFLGLAAYVAFESAFDLARRQSPALSFVGMALTCTSLVVMPLLSRAKKRIAKELGSRAMEADAKQADFCAYLSAITLAGLLLNAAFSWWWADATAALVMVPLIAKEGIQAVKGETCDCHQGDPP